MPIYEFYCADCHTIYSFLARTINTTKRPACPRCGRKRLERNLSRFAISRNRPESEEADAGMPDFDESKLESVMAELEREGENLNEDDPRQMARLMRKLAETGLPMGEEMEEAIRRMEAGEDPERIEEEMGEVFGDDEGDEAFPFGQPGKKLGRWARRLRPPAVDDTLYDL